MYQHILIPVDGSPTSERALQEALGLAKQHHAQLELVYVAENIYLQNSEIFIDYTELLETIKTNGEKILAEAQSIVQQAGMTAEVKFLDANGERIANMIVSEAKCWSADLIVIGTHGRSGFSRLLLGSVAEGVVRTAHIPVLLIRST
tara:strand:- start:2903 stop:3343 length:441 start_codon:yes stop_codon:yes gene_type:complete